MSDGGEPKQDRQTSAKITYVWWRRTKQDSKHRLRSPMSDGGELNRIANIG